jgi:hypothetical protein
MHPQSVLLNTVQREVTVASVLAHDTDLSNRGRGEVTRHITTIPGGVPDVVALTVQHHEPSHGGTEYWALAELLSAARGRPRVPLFASGKGILPVTTLFVDPAESDAFRDPLRCTAEDRGGWLCVRRGQSRLWVTAPWWRQGPTARCVRNLIAAGGEPVVVTAAGLPRPYTKPHLDDLLSAGWREPVGCDGPQHISTAKPFRQDAWLLISPSGDIHFPGDFHRTGSTSFPAWACSASATVSLNS